MLFGRLRPKKKCKQKYSRSTNLAKQKKIKLHRAKISPAGLLFDCCFLKVKGGEWKCNGLNQRNLYVLKCWWTSVLSFQTLSCRMPAVREYRECVYLINSSSFPKHDFLVWNWSVRLELSSRPQHLNVYIPRRYRDRTLSSASHILALSSSLDKITSQRAFPIITSLTQQQEFPALLHWS